MRVLSFVAPRADRLVLVLLLAPILLVSAGCMRMGGMPNLGNAFGQGEPQGLDPSSGPERALQTSPDTQHVTTEILPPEELNALYDAILSNYVDRVDHRMLLEGALRGVHAGAVEEGLLPMEAAVLDTMPLQFSPDPQRDFAQFGDRYDTFLNKLVPRVGATHIGQAAARGMLEALNDPLTTYVDRETVVAQEATENVGIGVVLAVSEDGDRPIIREVFPGSPAESAGLRPGDTIVGIDGRSTESTPLNDAVNRVSGPEGSSVTLRVQSVGQGEPRDVRVVRA
ncbi:MAG: PDZ domain-containing protein, partial [Chloroflexi bacterium]|nr:PDZ domain-containing protein [Chloroflexota bacterium]